MEGAVAGPVGGHHVLGEPASVDVAEQVMYLASPASDFINGDLIIIAGGQAQWGVVWPGGMPDYFDEGGAA